MMQGQNFSDSNHPDIVFILSSRQMFGRYGVGLRPEIWREFVTRFFFHFLSILINFHFLQGFLSFCPFYFLRVLFLFCPIFCTFFNFPLYVASQVQHSNHSRVLRFNRGNLRHHQHQKQRGGSAMEER